MQQTLQQFYLHQMGIDQWVLRNPEKSNQLADVIASERLDEDRTAALATLAKEVSTCQRCLLCKTRTQTVVARGNPQAKVMIVGEAPGFHEDQQGYPFVGAAGLLLNKMLSTIGLSEEDIYIVNVLKCRPPNNRDPSEEEISQCAPYLQRQIAIVMPKLLFAVGRFAGQFLTKIPHPLNRLRKIIHHYQDIPVIVSYHPAYLLHNPRDKKQAFMDLQFLKQALESKA